MRSIVSADAKKKENRASAKIKYGPSVGMSSMYQKPSTLELDLAVM
jgi:hypothetical protein